MTAEVCYGLMAGFESSYTKTPCPSLSTRIRDKAAAKLSTKLLLSTCSSNKMAKRERFWSFVCAPGASDGEKYQSQDSGGDSGSRSMGHSSKWEDKLILFPQEACTDTN